MEVIRVDYEKILINHWKVFLDKKIEVQDEKIKELITNEENNKFIYIVKNKLEPYSFIKDSYIKEFEGINLLSESNKSTSIILASENSNHALLFDIEKYNMRSWVYDLQTKAYQGIGLYFLPTDARNLYELFEEFYGEMEEKCDYFNLRK